MGDALLSLSMAMATSPSLGGCTVTSSSLFIAVGEEEAMGLEGGAVTTSVIKAASLEEEAGDAVGVGMVIQLDRGASAGASTMSKKLVWLC